MAVQFSIVLPTYNSPIGHLDTQLQSISAQEFGDFECIVVDDASTDGSVVDLIRDWAERDARIRVFVREHNGGIAAATNDAIAHADGEFVLFCDHDDVVHDDALQLIAEHLRAHPDDDVVYTDEQLIGDDGTHVADYRKPDYSPERLLGQNYFCHAVTVRRTLLEQVGPVDAAFEPCQDNDFNFRITSAARSVGHVPHILYSWRAVPGSIASSNAAKPGVREAIVAAAAAQLRRSGDDGVVVPTDDPTCVNIRRPRPADVTIGRIGISESTNAAEVRIAAQALDVDLVVLEPLWAPFDDEDLDPLVALAVRSDVAAVGPKLVTGDGRLVSAGRVHQPTIQDLGTGAADDDGGPWGAFRVTRECASVAPFALVARRAALIADDGLPRDVPLDLAVAEFCTRQRLAGRRTLWTPLSTVVVGVEARRDTTTSAQRQRALARIVDRLPEILDDPYSPLGVHRAAEGAGAQQTADQNHGGRSMFHSLKKQVVDRLGINRIAASADRANAELAFVSDELTRHAARIVSVEEHDAIVGDPRAVRRHLDERLDTRIRILETTQWAAHAPLRRTPLISVVLATRDRAAMLDTAIDSVVTQSYDRWELVVVDDGSTDETSQLVRRRAAADDRIVIVETSGVGAAAARNLGLAAATGEWVGFLDDDNTMHPVWLRAIAELAGRRGELQAFYGAQLRDDEMTAPTVPSLLFEERTSLDSLRWNNVIDLGVLAVRQDHPELRFDEERAIYIDWEMIVRLWEHAPLVPHPVIASMYSTRAATRISDLHDEETIDSMRRDLGN